MVEGASRKIICFKIFNMGSTRTRKLSDIPIISLKKKIEKGESSPSTSGSRSPTNDTELCPSSFRIKLPSGLRLMDGTRLTVRIYKNTVALYFGNTKITELNAKKGQRIAICVAKGFRYEGTVRKKGEVVYAEVIRTT